MDFLNKAFAQLSDLFKSMTPGARITAGLLLLLVVISLGYLFTYQVSGPDTDLMNGVSVPPSHIPLMLAAFDKAGLETPEIRGTQILVRSGQENGYMAALVDANALPPNIENVFDKTFEETGPFTSEKERSERLRIAKVKKLELTIALMNGIEYASVMYDTETKGGFRREKVTTASANIKPVGSEHLDEMQVAAIRNLIAGAIAPLKPQGVTVTDLNARRTYAGDPENDGTGDGSIYAALKLKYEREWRDKVLRSLGFIPNVIVEPNVVLDPQRKKYTTKVKHDPKPVGYKEIDESRSSVLEDSGPGSRPGLYAQGNVAAALSPTRTKGSRKEDEESKREVYSMVAGTQEETESVGLTPKLVKVSVGIPSSYFKQVWQERNPPEEGQQPQTPDKNTLDTIRAEISADIRKHVAVLLPAAEGVTDLTELVEVTTFQDITPEAIPVPGMSEDALAWFGRYWSTLGMIGVALFSLVMLRSMIRVAPAGPQTGGAPGTVPMQAGEAEGDSAEATIAKRLGRFSGSGRSLRDELTELVQEDPDAAANILRTWIGSAG